MDEDSADTDTTGPVASHGTAGPESSVDKVARDAEFTLFYVEDMPKLVGFLIVHGARPVTAAELAQDAMTEAYRQWDTIDAPRAWVRTVAARAWWRRAEREKKETSQEGLPEPNVLLSAEDSIEIENRHAFIALARGLPLRQRQVMAWTYDGYQPTEIAAMLGISPAAVRSALRDARTALRGKYQSVEGAP